MTRASRPTRAAAVGALLGPPAVTALLLALGYRLVPLGGLDNPRSVGLYVVALAVLGATVAAAYRLDLRATVVLAVGVTVVAAARGLFGPGPEWGDVLSFVAAAMFLAASTAVVAVGEFAWRYRRAARRAVPSRTARVATTVGVAHLALWLALRSAAVGWPQWRLTFFSFGLWVWATLGAMALGAVPVVLWRERDLVAPTVVVAGALAWAAWTTLSRPAVGASATSITLYGVGWFVPLAAALAAGAVEQAVRLLVTRRRASP